MLNRKALILSLLASSMLLVGCGQNEEHIHNFCLQIHSEDYIADEATCQSKATYFYACECGKHSNLTYEFGDVLPHSFSDKWSHDDNYHWHAATCGCSQIKDKSEHSWEKLETSFPASHLEEGHNSFKCSVCGLTKDEVLPKIGEHSFNKKVVDDKYLKSAGTCEHKAVYYYSCECGEKGSETFEVGDTLIHHFENGKCVYCSKALKDLHPFESLNGFYGLTYFFNSGKTNYASFYGAIDQLYSRIPLAVNDIATTEIGKIKFTDYGLTMNEAASVFNSYRSDHPGYYFIDPVVMYVQEGSDISFVFYIDEAYLKKASRDAAEAKIYNVLESFNNSLSSMNSTYVNILACHDYVRKHAETKYDEKGSEVRNISTRNIFSVLDSTGSCSEGYAKTLQLLLNFCGIENVLANNSSRYWNIVKLEGKYYNIDVSWDDAVYFNDYTQSYYFDGPYLYCLVGSGEFTKNHPTFEDDVSKSTAYCYKLPTVSSEDFKSEKYLGNRFELSGLFFRTISYDEVELYHVSQTGDIVVPQTVTNLGKTYKVVSIGQHDIDSEGRSIFEKNANSIYIPDSIEYIWDYALSGGNYGRAKYAEDFSSSESYNAYLKDLEKTYQSIYYGRLKEYKVSPTNKFYTAKDGILYSKNLKTLIAYPTASSIKEVTIPNETYFVADMAFGRSGAVSNLEKLVISENVYSVASVYQNTNYLPNWESSAETVLGFSNGFRHILKTMKDPNGLSLSSKNKAFYFVDKTIYSFGDFDSDNEIEALTLLCITDFDVKNYTIKAKITKDAKDYEVLLRCYLSSEGMGKYQTAIDDLKKLDSLVSENPLYKVESDFLIDVKTNRAISFINKGQSSVKIPGYLASSRVVDLIPETAKSVVKEFHVEEGITKIASFSFATWVEKIYIPKTIKYIAYVGFLSGNEVYYDGTRANFNSIEKENGWCWIASNSKLMIHCTDGDLEFKG